MGYVSSGNTLFRDTGAQTSCFQVFDPEIHDPQISNLIGPAAQNNVIFIIMRVGVYYSVRVRVSLVIRDLLKNVRHRSTF